MEQNFYENSERQVNRLEIESNEKVVKKAEQLAVALTSEHNDVKQETLYKALIEYKERKDGTQNNRNKPISDLLQALLEAIRDKLRLDRIKKGEPYKFQTAEEVILSGSNLAPQWKEQLATVDQKTGVGFCYKLLLIMRLILNAEKKRAKPSEINRSIFFKTILNSLTAILDVEKEESTLDQLIDKVINNINARMHRQGLYLNLSEHQLDLEKALQRLFEYIISKQLETGINKILHKSDKTEKCKAILVRYFTAESAVDYVNLFKEIADGIKLSRSKGKNKEKSRGLEFALVKLRDWLVYVIFWDLNNPITFDMLQLSSIIDSINSPINDEGEENLRYDVCPYTLDVIERYKKQAKFENNFNPRTVMNLRIEHIKRLALKLPDKANGMVIDKGEYFYKCGEKWAATMTQLLKGSDLDAAQREEMSICALTWNMHIAEYYEKHSDINIELIRKVYIKHNLLDFTVSIKNPLFPRDLSNNYDVYNQRVLGLSNKLATAQRQSKYEGEAPSQPVFQPLADSPVFGSKEKNNRGNKDELGFDQDDDKLLEFEQENPKK